MSQLGTTKSTLGAVKQSALKLRTPTAAIANVSRRPVLSVRRRIINTPATQLTATSSVPSVASIITTTTTAAQTPITTTTISAQTTLGSLPTVTDLPATTMTTTTTSKFSRLRIRPATTALSTAGVTTTTPIKSAITTTIDAGAAATYIPNNNKNNNNNYLSNKLKTKTDAAAATTTTLATFTDILATSSSVATFVANDISHKSQQQKYASTATTAALRRKLQTRRLPATTTTTRTITGATDESATEQPRTQNPLFKRRFSRTFTTAKLARPRDKSGHNDTPTSNLDLDAIELEEETDQVAKSSIHTSRFNQLANNAQSNDDEENVSGLVRILNVSGQVKPAQQTPKGRTKVNGKGQSVGATETITRRMDTVSTEATQANKRQQANVKRRQQKTTMRQQPTQASRRRTEHLNQRQNGNAYAAAATAGKARQTGASRGSSYESSVDYAYYDEEVDSSSGSSSNTSGQQLKVILHGRGIIECLDQGNFPHPLSCNKFISCAKFETGGVVGWEYTCPKGLIYDPVGGMCNWSANNTCKD